MKAKFWRDKRGRAIEIRTHRFHIWLYGWGTWWWGRKSWAIHRYASSIGVFCPFFDLWLYKKGTA